MAKGRSTPNKSAATIKVQSQPKSSVVSGSSTAKLAAAKAQQAIEAAAGIKSTVSTALKAGAQQEAATAKKAETPLNKPNVITRSGNAVFQNGKLVANYADSATADASIARMQNATGKGAIIGDNAGTTYRKLYKPAPVPIGGVGAPKPAITPDAPTDTGSLTVPTGTVGDTSTDANGINRPIASTTTPTTAYGQKLGTTPSATTAADSGYYTDKPEAARSLQDIRQEELAQAQSKIDATTALFNSEMQRLTQQGEAALAQTSAYDVGAGLAGSPFQTANENQQKAANTQQYQALSAQRSSDIATIMDKANDDAQTIYQQGLENYRADQSTYIDERDKATAAASADAKAKKDAATSTISTLAKGGYSIDELPKGQYQELLAASGMSDFEARAVWAAASPEANATYETMNGFLVGTYFDPHTGKPVVTKTAMPEGLEEGSKFEVVNIGNDVLMYDPNDKWNVDGSLKTVKFSDSDLNKAPVTDELLSPTEASALGVLYGTTQAEAAAMGIDTTLGGLTKDQRTYLNQIQDNARQDPNIKDFAAVRASYETAVSSSKTGDGAGDIVLMRMLAKITDPTTGVREEEFRTFEGAQGTLARFGITLTKKMWDGERLTTSARASLLAQAEDIYKQRESAYNNSISFYDSQATDAGIPEGKVTAAYTAPTVGSSPGIQFNQSYNSVDDILQDYPELQSQADALSADYSPSDILQFFENEYGSFSTAASTALNSSVAKVTVAYKAGQKGGQCAYWTNRRTGLKMGDSFESKMAETDPSIKVGQPGDVGVAKLGIWTGHTFMVLKTRPRADGTVDYDVIDSNYGEDEKIRYHTFNSSKVNGFARPSKITA